MRRRPILQDPIQRTILVFLLVLIFYAYLTYRLGGLTGNIVAIAVDFLILVLGFFLWLAFFSQFVLPVRNLTERYQAFRRLRSYFGGRGGRGPAIFIVNGQVQQRAGESKRRGPGVILLDTASAGVLRGARGFTRAIGPGIVFTQRNEYLAGTVDLHPQTRTIGPPPEENPFSPRVRKNQPKCSTPARRIVG